MKNLKVSLKLIISFTIVIVLTIAVGAVGIIGMVQLERAGTDMYNEEVEPLPYIARASEMLQRTRVAVREMILGVVENDTVARDNAFEDILSYVEQMTSDLDAYSIRITNDEIRQYFDSGRTVFERDLVPVVLGIHEASLADDMPRILALLEDCRIYAEMIIVDFERCLELSVEDAAASNVASSQLGTVLLIAIIAFIVFAAAVAIFMALYISGLISKPMAIFDSWMETTAKEGNIEWTDEEMVIYDRYGHRRDEIGTLFRSYHTLIEYMENICGELQKIARGDISFDAKKYSDKDKISSTLQELLNDLNGMFSEVKSSATQVAAGSKQIAEGSQSLAQGSTEQAASVQQLSSSITEIAQKTKDNAGMAERAATLANEIKSNAEKGSGQMDEMMAAVKDINEASQNISKVIKSIDDIAFQTNILALNAAVEAARAGQHGKGFAVVAEEVRNLAAKSAESAKDTERLIADSIEKAELGSRIADETAASLTEIVSGIGESSQLVNDIAKSSDEQFTGINQINQGIDQVTQVTQQNSATAEESAAASQEMSGQSLMLEEMISRFKLKGLNNVFVEKATTKRQIAPDDTETDVSIDIPAFSGYGKY